jgi:signal transduction histidine kinase
MFWGDELTFLYNDAYRELILEKHPAAMGRVGREVFPEIWEQLEPLLLDAKTRGTSSRYADRQLAIERRGFVEEAYFTFSLTPVKGSHGEIEGLVCAAHETTRRVTGERRLQTLRELLGASNQNEGPEEVCRRAARALAENRADIPFALFYLNEGATSGLVAAAGVPLAIEERLRKLPVAAAVLQRSADERSRQRLERLLPIFPSVEAKAWEGLDHPSQVVPLMTPEPSQASGYLVAGLSKRLPFEGEYRDFLELIGALLGRMVASGQAEEEARISGALMRFGERAGADRESILRTLTSEAQRLCNADFGAFFTEAGEMEAVAGKVPVNLAGVVQSPLPDLIAQSLKAGLVIRIADLGEHANAGGSSARTGSAAVRSSMAVPVIALSGQVHGGLILGDAKADRFGARHERRVAILAAHAAIALDNAGLLTAEREIHRSLSRALAIRDNFLSIASHELRNPLNSLHLRLNILKREIDVLANTVPEARRLDGHVDKAVAQVTRMTRLLDRLLDISLIASGRVRLEPRQYDMAASLKQMVERFADQAAPGQLRLAAPEQVAGCWDEMRTDQVVTNLLSNAMKYGDGKPIGIALRAQENWIEIEVADNGIGIAAEDQERVFERFERVENDRPRTGFGLGLWISRQIVTAMGGEIALKSEPGHGTAFTVRLPRRTSKAG